MLKRIIAMIKKIVWVCIILLICFVILCSSQGKHPKIFGYQVLRVLTSSMQPAISENTCIITKEVPQEELKEGDIITFISENEEIYGFYNTHRIYRIIEEDGVIKYETKGDANELPDEELVTYDQISGRFVRELPGGVLLGKLFLALSDNKVYFIVVMLPLAICLISYIWQIIGYMTHRYDDEE